MIEPGPVSSESAVALERPYKGLEFYTDSDADAFLFVGRESETNVIAANVRASRLTLLYGPSGVGKSSVLHAGVAVELRRQAMERALPERRPRFGVVIFRSWHGDPVEGLLDAVEECVVGLVGEPEKKPARGDRLAEQLKAWSSHLRGDVLIILDQFEEYFLYRSGSDEEGSFAAEFPRAVNTPGLHVNFLVSIREDALARLDVFKGRIPTLFDNYLRIDNLSRTAAKAAIVEPLERFRRAGDFEGPAGAEPELVTAVLDGVRAGTVAFEPVGRGGVESGGGTPSTGGEEPVEPLYLQLVLTRLWDAEVEAGSRNLRLETLVRLGGAQSIVRQHLEEAIAALEEDERDVAARAFVNLVTPAGGKIALTVSQLASDARLPEDRLRDVLDKLVDARILNSDKSAEPRYEIFHDALAAAVLEWRRRYEESREQQERERLAAAEREAERRRRRTRLYKLFAGALIAVLILFAALAVAAWAQRNNAIDERQQARSQERAAAAFLELGIDPSIALRRAVAAVREARTLQALGAIRAALAESHLRRVLRHDGQVIESFFSPDGQRVLTTSTDGRVTVWAADKSQPLSGTDFSAVAIAPDGRFAVTGSESGEAVLWNVATGARVRTLGSHNGEILEADFGPRGLAVTAGGDGTARIWNTRSGGVHVLRGGSLGGDVEHAMVNRTGTTVLTVGVDGTGLVWNAHTGKRLYELDQAAGILTAAFSPDGRRIATGDENGGVRIWEGRRARLLPSGHTAAVRSVAFSGDGRRLVTASDDGSARVWDLRGRGAPVELRGHSGPVVTAVFSPDGGQVATGGIDGTARLWNASTGATLMVLPGHTGEVHEITFAPDARRLLTGSFDGTARVWDLAVGRSVRALRGHRGSILAVELSRDGSLALSVGEDGTARIWSTHGRRGALATLGTANTHVRVAAMSPDGERVATGDEKGIVRVWSRATGRSVQIGRHLGPITSVDFSPDGERVLSGGTDGDARVWKTVGGEAVTVLKGHAAPIIEASFSAGGQRVVTASQDGTARVWTLAPGPVLRVQNQDVDITSARPDVDAERIVTVSSDRKARLWSGDGKLIAVLMGHTGPVNSGAFGPRGRRLVTAGKDGVALWRSEDGAQLSALLGHTESVLSASFSPDGELVLTTSKDGTARVWDAVSGRTLLVLRGSGAKMNAAAVSVEDGMIATAGDDGTVRLYRCSVCGTVDRLLDEASSRP